MVCNETRIRITENLFHALTWIRLQTRPRLVWIDFLSISQTDLAEKSDQVARMGRIFHQAHVISYIGGNMDPDLADTCLAVIRRLSDISDHISSQRFSRKDDAILSLPPMMYDRNRPISLPDWHNVPWVSYMT